MLLVCVHTWTRRIVQHEKWCLLCFCQVSSSQLSMFGIIATSWKKRKLVQNAPSASHAASKWRIILFYVQRLPVRKLISFRNNIFIFHVLGNNKWGRALLSLADYSADYSRMHIFQHQQLLQELMEAEKEAANMQRSWTSWWKAVKLRRPRMFLWSIEETGQSEEQEPVRSSAGSRGQILL